MSPARLVGPPFETALPELGLTEEQTAAAIVASMIRTFGELRHGTDDPAERERRTQVLVAQSRSIERILGDSYLLVAAAVELRRHLLPFGDNRTVLEAVRRRLRWLSADDETLDRARHALTGEDAHV